jgi:Tfp pilus assembly protein PilO
MILAKWLEDQDFSLAEFEEKLDIFRENQRYVYIIVGVFLVIYLFFALIWTDFTDYRKRSKNLREFEAVLVEKRKQVMNKENIEKELTRLRQLVIEKKSLFFSEKDAQYFHINVVHQLAESAGMEISSRVYSKKQTVSHGIVSYPLKLTMTADFRRLTIFMDAIENYEKVVKISDLSISVRSLEPIVLSVKMTLGAYGL